MSGVLLGALVLASVGTADPWARPADLRAVAEPPATVAALDRSRRPVRLWWSTAEAGAGCEIAQRTGGGWRVVATDAVAGWTSRPVADGTAFRVRCDAAARWSAPVVSATAQ